MRKVKAIEQEINETKQNIRISEAAIKGHEKGIEMEKRQILQFKSWQLALEWTLEDTPPF